MLKTTSKTLIRMAAVLWYSGFVVLIAKSYTLLLEALHGGADQLYVLMAALFGIGIGKLKAQYLFYDIGRKNIDRINKLTDPRLWQFYRKRFFVFLFSMIALGKFLAGVAHGRNTALIALAVLELSVAFALLFSSRCFWRK